MTLLQLDEIHAANKRREKSAASGGAAAAAAVAEDARRLLKYLCICGGLAFVPFVLVNGFLLYSSFIPDEALSYSEHSSMGSNVSDPPQECDTSRGMWIPDSQPPLYTNETCHYIQGHQNCMRNGRPDTGYLQWKWKPHDCELPSLDARLFLELLRDKSIVFIGDSIARNHMQSLLCVLSQVDNPRNLYRDPDDKDLKWLFPSYNLRVAIFWSPYLIKHVKEKETTVIHLHLDTPEEVWKNGLAEYDLAILSTGPWYFKGSIYYLNNKVIGCHHCDRNLTKMVFTDAYRTALRNTFDSMAAHSGYRGVTILRTFSVEHFEGGEWWNGGHCNRTSPYQNQSLAMPWMSTEMHRVQLEEFARASSRGSTSNGSRMKLLDVTYSAFLRPDGHPGQFRSLVRGDPPVQDCLHWCLPGPIDMWNQVMLKMLKDKSL